MHKTLLQTQSAVYREKIITEICYALGFSRTGLARGLVKPLFWLPASRFGKIAAKADDEVQRTGIAGASRLILPDFSMNAIVHGAENIPSQGSMLLVSNHPGAYDSVVIMSCVPRKDLKIILTDVPFTRAFNTSSRYFIYVGEDSTDRMAAIRAGIAHLKSGGALMIFPHGEVEPDPELAPGAHAAIQDWSRSVEIMLRKAPETMLQVTIASGVLMTKFYNSPLTKIHKDPPKRQKMAEFLQISQQMVLPRSVQATAHISFAKPVRAKDIPQDSIMPTVIQLGQQLLEEHMQRLAKNRP
jgi:1-acyl-sn-glycerol-3-phosphate acyltransferase